MSLIIRRNESLRTESGVVTSYETRAIDFTEVTEARFLEIMRALRIVASPVFRIAFTRFQTLVIALVRRRRRIVKGVICSAPITPRGKWAMNDGHTLLCLRRRARQENHETRKKQQHSQNQSAKST